MREHFEGIVELKNCPNVLIVGVDTGEDAEFAHSIEELRDLAKACNKKVVGVMTQRLETPNRAFYIGAGKVDEVLAFANTCEAEEVIFDNSLSPSQVRNLSDRLGLTVLDRTNLILDIFALRARTGEAKLQVETARLQYLLPRLVGNYDELSRQGGTGGSMSNKGTGEKKLELDRRRIEHRISELKRELENMAGSRSIQRKKRCGSTIPQVALVGYTNAGKSTVLNHMVQNFGKRPEKQVTEKNMLFATLDTSVRLIEPDDNKPFFLVDTVGFIDKLPHGLIKAFRSTLEEVKYADLLVHVVDFSDENYRQQMEVTNRTLKELEAAGIPRIVAYNKADQRNVEDLPIVRNGQIYMSAANNVGIYELTQMIKNIVYADYVDCTFLIPYDKGNDLSYLLENGTVYSTEYREDGVLIQINCSSTDASKYDKMSVGGWEQASNAHYEP